jgi:hypothetical protein
MPEFVMDRDGEVSGQSFDDLSPFLQGYIECMLFTETCTGISMVDWEDPENKHRVAEGQADGNIPTDSGFGDIHPDTLIQMHADCSDFQAKARDLLSQAYARGYEPVQAGRDFWFTRNGHGVGYWDREVLNEGCMAPSPGGLGEKLTEVAQTFGETWSEFAPDESSPTGYGFVHLS